MAAKNNDSKSIFDLYIDRYLNEQLAGVPAQGGAGNAAPTATPGRISRADAEKSVKNYQDTVKNRQALAQQQARARAATPDASQVGAGGYNIPSGGGTAPQDSSSFSMTPTKPANSAAEPAAQAQSQSQSSWNLTSVPDTSLQTVKPGEAVAQGTAAETGLGAVAKTSSESGDNFVAQGDKATGNKDAENFQAVTKASEVTPEEKELFKKLHGSEYAPGVGDKRLGELRQAVKQTGSTDISKIAPAAYAQQYAGTPQGQAFAKKAEAMGIKVPKPGEVSSTPTNYAQQFVSPETQALLSQQGGQQSQQQTAKPSMNPQDYISLGQQLGLSNSTIEALQKDLTKAS
jgi:hypothetical protein